MSVYWNYLGASILKKKKEISDAVFKQFFKIPISLAAIIWKRLVSRFPNASPIHFLWTLHFLKSKTPEIFSIAQLLNTNKKTLKTHLTTTLVQLLVILPKVPLYASFILLME
jgi:hypothetical protein